MRRTDCLITSISDAYEPLTMAEERWLLEGVQIVLASVFLLYTTRVVQVAKICLCCYLFHLLFVPRGYGSV